MQVSATGSRRAGWNAQKHLDVLVRRSLASPLVPCVEVEVVLLAGAGVVRLHAAVVVVELDENGVEADGIEEGLVCGVGVRALWRGCKVALLAVGSVVDEAAELSNEGHHVLDGGLEVKVKAVDGRRIERSQRAAAGVVRPENIPNLVGSIDGGRFTCESAFSVCGATN